MKEWVKLYDLLLEKVALMDKGQQFIEHALKLRDARYVWGKENPMETDCSGTVCFPLYLMGYNIRITADALFHEVFTENVSGVGDEMDPTVPKCVFYRTLKEKKHGGVTVDAGHVVHVTPVVGEYCVLHAGGRVVIKTASAVRLMYEGKGCEAVWRAINWNNVKALSASGKHMWDIDPVLLMFRQVV